MSDTNKAERKKSNGAIFVDMSNLFHGGKDYAGWLVDYEKTRTHLESLYSIKFFRLYGGEDKTPSTQIFKDRAIKQDRFHKKLIQLGFDLFLKPLQYIDGRIDGDLDSDIMSAMRQYMLVDEIEDIILFSGDHHFLPAIRECCNKGKYVHIYSFDKTLAKTIKEFSKNNQKLCKIIILDKRKDIFGKFSGIVAVDEKLTGVLTRKS